MGQKPSTSKGDLESGCCLRYKKPHPVFTSLFLEEHYASTRKELTDAKSQVEEDEVLDALKEKWNKLEADKEKYYEGLTFEKGNHLADLKKTSPGVYHEIVMLKNKERIDDEQMLGLANQFSFMRKKKDEGKSQLNLGTLLFCLHVMLQLTVPLILGLEGYVGGSKGKRQPGNTLNIIAVAISLCVMVLTTIGETYHFRATGKKKLAAWDKARLLLTQYYDGRLEPGDEYNIIRKDGESGWFKDDGGKNMKEGEEGWKQDKEDLDLAKYKYFKDQLAPIYEEIRGAKFADAES